MIDLRFDSLPGSIEVNGELFLLRTSFRVWLEFGRVLEEEHVAWLGIFAEKIPDADWVPAAIEFYQSPVATPRGIKKNDSRRVVDYIADGDYIVGSFQSAYGIDLTTQDMHWHRFLALFRSLPESTKMVEVMGYRSYNRAESRKKSEVLYEDARRQWSLPPKQDKKIIAAQQAMFSGVTYRPEESDGGRKDNPRAGS